MIIGITGGIGSGKSTIAQELARRGFAVYDCDREAKRIITEDEQVKKAIIGLLGEEAFVDGKYNTAYVSQRVFADKALLEQLNAIVHPAVKKDIKAKRQELTADRYLFIESAILYEAGMDTLCDKVIAVDAPEDVRIARTIERDYQGAASEENINKVRARIRAQHRIPYTIHHTPAILTVNNDGKTSIADLVENMLNWLKKAK